MVPARTNEILLKTCFNCAFLGPPSPREAAAGLAMAGDTSNLRMVPTNVAVSAQESVKLNTITKNDVMATEREGKRNQLCVPDEV